MMTSLWSVGDDHFFYIPHNSSRGKKIANESIMEIIVSCNGIWITVKHFTEYVFGISEVKAHSVS